MRIAAGVVDDDEVGAAGLGELGRDARAGARADDGSALRQLSAQALEYFFPRVSHADVVSLLINLDLVKIWPDAATQGRGMRR